MSCLYFTAALKKHIEQHHGYKCSECGIDKFMNKYNYARHMRNIHGKTPLIVHSCMLCKLQFKTKEEYTNHNIIAHSKAQNEGGFKMIENALRGHVQNYRKIIRSGPSLSILLSDEYLLPLLNLLEEERLKKAFYKVGLVVICAYDSVTVDDNDDTGTRQIPLRYRIFSENSRFKMGCFPISVCRALWVRSKTIFYYFQIPHGINRRWFRPTNCSDKYDK